MNNKTKKRIAKEIIIFFIGLGIAILTFLFIYPYNWFFQFKSSNCVKSITEKYKQADSFDSLYLTKQKKHKWFYDKNVEEGWATYVTYDSLWSRLTFVVDMDSLEYKYANTWGNETRVFLDKLGFTTAAKFKDFIIKNRFSKEDTENHSKATAIRNEINTLTDSKYDYKQKELSFADQFNFSLIVFIIALIVLFPLRFLYYLLKWSIKTVKQKEN